MPTNPLLDPNPAIPGYPNGFSGGAGVTPGMFQPQPLAPGLGPDLTKAASGAADAGAPTGAKASDNAKAADSDLSGATATPCKDCGTTAYSLAFCVKDKNGKLCKGMWYSVWSKTLGGRTGQIDENGLTQRYPGPSEEEELYLYLGHRDDLDKDHPTERDTEDNKYDEAPLAHDKFGPVADKKISDAKSERLWKPWSVGSDGKEWLKKEEGFERTPYNDHLGYATWGIGHLLHRSPVTAADKKAYPEPTTPEETAETDQKINDTFNQDVASNGGDKLDSEYFVPLYQREYDALISMGFQFGPGSLTGTIKKYINQGRYKKGGDAFKLYSKSRNAAGQLQDDPKVIARQNRRMSTFFDGTYQGP